ncbi:MAG: citryl-CoA lyase [Phycisphaeraceae bacterium]|nr:citryl-CoA lyase [Phycisphaeraceae bacterium]MCW5762186.1 citryl-CoA lyase [Phycisphaeraceae bacterium]
MTSWPTAITEIAPNRVRVRGQDIAALMGSVSFGEAVHLILLGRLPTAEVGRLFEAMLVSSIDHGATPPSALAARTVASTGASLSASVAAGIMSINAHHGGAIEACARTLGQVLALAGAGSTLDEAAASVIAQAKTRGEKLAGFGHRVHTADPRTARLFELARQAGLDETRGHIAAARAIEAAFAASGKALPINVDGAIGAIAADLGVDCAIMNGLFMIARVPGLVAHVAEEKARMKPMRPITPGAAVYDGPGAAPADGGTGKAEGGTDTSEGKA